MPVQWRDLDRLRRQHAFYNERWYRVGREAYADTAVEDHNDDLVATFEHEHHAELVCEIHNHFAELANALLMMGKLLHDLKDGKKGLPK